MIKLIAVFTILISGRSHTQTMTYQDTFKDLAACEAVRSSAEVLKSVERMRVSILHPGLVAVTVETQCVPGDDAI